MNRDNIIQHNMLRTIFKEDDRIGSYYWVRVKTPPKATIAIGPEKKDVLDWETRIKRCFYRCKKNITASDKHPADIEEKFYAMRIFAWRLSRCSKYAKKYTLMSNGIIFNEKAIKATLKSLSDASKSIKQMTRRQKLVLFARSVTVVGLALIIAIFIFMMVSKAGSLLNIANQSLDYGESEKERVIARWNRSADHFFTRSVVHKTGVIMFLSATPSIIALYMVFSSALTFAIAAVAMPFKILFQENDMTLEKECLAEMQTYEELLEELAKNRVALDELSWEILQKKGVAEQEMEDYSICGNSTLLSAKMVALFKKIREYSSKESFHKSIGLELDEVCSIFYQQDLPRDSSRLTIEMPDKTP